MLDITKFPHDIQDKIYSMYFNKHAIIIQKYWRRKDIYLNLLNYNYINIMYVQIENTPNPNSLKFIPGKKVSKVGPLEILDSKDTENELLKNILSINGVRGIFLYENFISVNKSNNIEWSELKHIIISYINDFYLKGNEFVISDNVKKNEKNLDAVSYTHLTLPTSVLV